MNEAETAIVKFPPPVKRSKKFVDHSGKRFGHLTAIKCDYRIKLKDGWRDFWLCRCDCGKESTVMTFSLVNGSSKSCGCFGKEVRRTACTIHGGIHKIEYGNWRGMLDRCYNKNKTGYQDYGGRGIAVCDRWRHSFQNFFADMGERPSKRHSIDRFPDKNGNYEPSNCRWATPKEQQNNTRRNRVLECDGVSHTISQWMQISGVKIDTISGRIKRGWSIKDSIWKAASLNAKRIKRGTSKLYVSRHIDG